MNDATRAGIRALLKADATLTPAARHRKLAALEDEPIARPANGEVPKLCIVSRSDAAVRLGNKTTRLVDLLTRQGVLEKIRLPGRQRSLGISEQSLIAAISG